MFIATLASDLYRTMSIFGFVLFSQCFVINNNNDNNKKIIIIMAAKAVHSGDWLHAVPIS